MKLVTEVKKMSRTVKRACVSLLTAALALTLAAGVGMPFAVKAEVAGAELVSVRLSGGPDWQNLGYGQKGYVLPGDQAGDNNRGTVYSDLYEGNDGKTQMSLSIHGSGYRYADQGYTLKSGGALSDWKLWAITYGSYTHANGLKPYAPDTQTAISSRAHGRADRPGIWSDVSFSLTLNGEGKTTVTLYLYDASSRASSDNPMVVNVYAGTEKKLIDVGDKTIEEHYGTALAGAEIAASQAYVSFELDASAAKTYQIVAFDKNRGGNTGTAPAIGGVFLDEEIASVGASFIREDKETGVRWQGTYGEDGYVVYYVNADHSGNDFPSAYTKGIYADGGQPYTGSVTYTNKLTGTGGAWTADKTMSKALVTRYGTSYGIVEHFDSKNWGAETIAAYKARTLRLPDSEEGTNTRMGAGSAVGVGVAAFTLSANAFSEHTYVDVSVYFANTFDSSTAGANLKTAVYPTYYAWHINATDSQGVNPLQTTLGALTPLAEHTVNIPSNGQGFYVTYRLSAPGDYSIYVMNDAEKQVRGTVDGVFFDLKGAKAVRTITYVLGEGESVPSGAITQYSEGDTAQLPAARKAHRKFTGWYDAPEGGNRIESITPQTEGDLTLYPRFEVITHAVTYVLDGGTNSPDNAETYVEGAGMTLAAAAKEGFTFDGWYADALFINKVTSIAADKTGAVTLYAKFTQIPADPEPIEPDPTPGGDDPTPDPDPAPGGDNGNTDGGKKKGCGCTGGATPAGAAGVAVAVLAAAGCLAVVLRKTGKSDI